MVWRNIVRSSVFTKFLCMLLGSVLIRRRCDALLYSRFYGWNHGRPQEGARGWPPGFRHKFFPYHYRCTYSRNTDAFLENGAKFAGSVGHPMTMLSAPEGLRPPWPGALPLKFWTPLGALPPDPRYRLVLRNRHGAPQPLTPSAAYDHLEKMLWAPLDGIIFAHGPYEFRYRCSVMSLRSCNAPTMSYWIQPTAANYCSSSGFAVVGPCWDRQTDRHHTVS